MSRILTKLSSIFTTLRSVQRNPSSVWCRALLRAPQERGGSFHVCWRSISRVASTTCFWLCPPQINLTQSRGFSASSSFKNEDNALESLKNVSAEIAQNKYGPNLSSSPLHRPVKIESANHPWLRSMAGRFARLYRKLGPQRLGAPESCQRTAVLQFIATECTIDPMKVSEAIRILEEKTETMKHGPLDNTGSNATEMPLSTYSRLQASCTAPYEDLFSLLLQHNAVEGMQFVLELREDLLRWIPCHASTDQQQANLVYHLKQLDMCLQQLLATWMVPGLLAMERLTYEETSAHILERIVRNEAVHPVSSLKDLRKRLGPGRRVFALFHPCLPKEPLFVLYVALQNDIPSSMEQIHSIDRDSFSAQPTVAAFYSISNLRSGLAGIGLAEYLIHSAVRHVQETVPSVQTFCTLSPMPSFRSWLTDRLNNANNATLSSDLVPVPSEDVLASIKAITGTTADTASGILIAALDGLATAHDRYPETDGTALMEVLLRPWLMECAAHYLAREKHRRKPLDKVARFHVGNGAIMDRIHWKADPSTRGWRNSWGTMVTYRYDLDLLSQHQSEYETNNYRIPLGAHVRTLLNKDD